MSRMTFSRALGEAARRAPRAALLVGGTLLLCAVAGTAITLLASFGVERMVLCLLLAVPAAFGGLLIHASQRGWTQQGLLACSFCLKSQLEVRKLVAGPSVQICDECIGLCNEILSEDDAKAAPADSDAPVPPGGGDGA